MKYLIIFLAIALTVMGINIHEYNQREKEIQAWHIKYWKEQAAIQRVAKLRAQLKKENSENPIAAPVARRKKEIMDETRIAVVGTVLSGREKDVINRMVYQRVQDRATGQEREKVMSRRDSFLELAGISGGLFNFVKPQADVVNRIFNIYKKKIDGGTIKSVPASVNNYKKEMKNKTRIDFNDIIFSEVWNLNE